jgi:AmiR/NasT family two-component response regulator
MGDQETTTKLRTRHGAGQDPTVFRRAVSILQDVHGIAEMAAYEMLVDGAVVAGTSVREVAKAVIASADGPA